MKSANQNQDQQPANQNQEQPVANQNEQLIGQNEEPQANDPQLVVHNQAQPPGNQNQDGGQHPGNGDADQRQLDAENPRVPYGVITIHSDQPNDNNYAEVRGETDDDIQDITYDRVKDDNETAESGYSTVTHDQTMQQQQRQEQRRKDRMYESVDEAFNRETKPR